MITEEIPGGQRFKVCEHPGCGNPAAFKNFDGYVCEEHLKVDKEAQG